MVVWRSLVSRTVCLHTGTMGMHRACFYRLGSESHYPGAESPRKIISLSYAAFLLSRTNWRALGIFSWRSPVGAPVMRSSDLPHRPWHATSPGVGSCPSAPDDATDERRCDSFRADSTR